MSDLSTIETVIQTSDGRLVPGECMIGVSELASLLTARIHEMTNLVRPLPTEISRQQVSTWSARRATTRFPDHLRLGPDGILARGKVWDIRDFIDESTGRLLWLGPPGRWAIDDTEDETPETL
jgi:hypothetical protein